MSRCQCVFFVCLLRLVLTFCHLCHFPQLFYLFRSDPMPIYVNVSIKDKSAVVAKLGEKMGLGAMDPTLSQLAGLILNPMTVAEQISLKFGEELQDILENEYNLVVKVEQRGLWECYFIHEVKKL
jgi:hypothetical protein